MFIVYLRLDSESEMSATHLRSRVIAGCSRHTKGIVFIKRRANEDKASARVLYVYADGLGHLRRQLGRASQLLKPFIHRIGRECEDLHPIVWVDVAAFAADTCTQVSDRQRQIT
jgi:hypothetical protein